MSDDDLFAYARRNDPATAKAAAEAMNTRRLSALQEEVLMAIEALGGDATSEEVVLASGGRLTYWNASPRFKPLEKLRKIRRAGTRANRSGRQAIVWEIVHEGNAPVQNDNQGPRGPRSVHAEAR